MADSTSTIAAPMFVGEIVRLSSVEADPAIPPSARDAIARRLTHVSQECGRLLVLASVLGREFALDVLARLGEVADEQLLDTLDEAIAARILTDVPGAPDRLRFAHVLIRDTLYEDLPSARRARLHGRAVAAHGVDGDPAELARHAIAAGDRATGLVHARRAGDRALGLRAYEEAARLYRLALEAAERADRGELLLALGHVLMWAGNIAEAKATFLSAGDLARATGLPELLARAALGYGGSSAWQRAGDDADYGRMLLARDDPRAAELLASAAASFRELGMESWAALTPRA